MFKQLLKPPVTLMVLLLCSLLIPGCDYGNDSGSSDKSFTIKGTVTLPMSVTNKKWFITIDADHAMYSDYSDSGTLTGNSFEYEIEFKGDPGEYYIYGEVDIDGDAGPWESGDYVGDACYIDGDYNEGQCTIDITESGTYNITMYEYNED